MKKINFINQRMLQEMMRGHSIMYRKEKYFARPDYLPNGSEDLNNGSIYKRSEDELILGSIAGVIYGKVIDNVPYRV